MLCCAPAWHLAFSRHFLQPSLAREEPESRPVFPGAFRSAQHRYLWGSALPSIKRCRRLAASLASGGIFFPSEYPPSNRQPDWVPSSTCRVHRCAVVVRSGLPCADGFKEYLSCAVTAITLRITTTTRPRALCPGTCVCCTCAHLPVRTGALPARHMGAVVSSPRTGQLEGQGRMAFSAI